MRNLNTYPAASEHRQTKAQIANRHRIELLVKQIGAGNFSKALLEMAATLDEVGTLGDNEAVHLLATDLAELAAKLGDEGL
jgi:truncated hemoglobin YjbI